MSQSAHSPHLVMPPLPSVLGNPLFIPAPVLRRYNLLREESEGWAKAVDVLNQKQPTHLSPEALQHMVRRFLSIFIFNSELTGARALTRSPCSNPMRLGLQPCTKPAAAMLPGMPCTCTHGTLQPD